MGNTILILSGIGSMFGALALIYISIEYRKRVDERNKYKGEINAILNYMYPQRPQIFKPGQIISKMKSRDGDVERLVRQVENASYGLEDYKVGDERLKINWSEMIRDIATFKKSHDKVEHLETNHKAEMEEATETLGFIKLELQKDKTFRRLLLQGKSLYSLALIKMGEGDQKQKDLVAYEKTSTKMLKAKNQEIEKYKTLMDNIRKEFSKIFVKQENKPLLFFTNMVVTRYQENIKKINEIMVRSSKKEKELNKKIHSKDQAIYSIRKKHNIPAPKRILKKTRQTGKKK